MILYTNPMFRFAGEAESQKEGHVSGPKLCPGVFYPRYFFKESQLLKYPLYSFLRVWAKKLRAEVMSVYPAFRSVECDMMEIRAVGKRRIDRMYYLDTEQQQR